MPFATIPSMKIALPVWESRVSPVFDVAGRLLIVDVEDGLVSARDELPLATPDPSERVRRLSELGIEVLICGAISRFLEAELLASGLRTIPRVCGEVEDIIQAYLTGTLTQPAFQMPGCCRRRRRGRQGRGFGSRRGCQPPGEMK
jgi:predicted Fe-Mo cluster-binding NifX family protein